MDISNLDPEQFDIVEKNGFTLIKPKKTKFTWSDDELNYRSLVLNDNKEVVSRGFPKFFNYGERPDNDRLFHEALLSGEVTFSEKVDGSLLVFSPKYGTRTRGNHDCGDFTAYVAEALCLPVWKVLREWMESVEDTGLSYLFEFCHPKTQIVIPVKTPTFAYLGATVNLTGQLIFDKLLPAGTCPEAPLWSLPIEKDALITAIRGWKGREGVVARWKNAQNNWQLLKLKSDEYIKLHAYRSSMTETGVKRLAWLLDLTEEAQAVKILQEKFNLDEETCAWSVGLMKDFLKQKDLLSAERIRADKHVAHALSLPTRKDAALYLKANLTDQWFSYAMNVYSDRPDKAQDSFDGLLLQEPASAIQHWRKDREAMIAAFVKEQPGSDG